jgi:uncharacterized membrane protein
MEEGRMKEELFALFLTILYGSFNGFKLGHPHSRMTPLRMGFFCIAMLFFSQSVWGATISGVVYDGLTLEPQENSILTINTSPIQTKVSKDGSYSFTVENGEYLLEAEYRENGVVTQRAQRNVSIAQDGTFTIDIILLPEIGNVPDDPLPGEEKEATIFDQIIAGPGGWLLLMLLVLAATGYSIWNVHRNTRRATGREHATEKHEHSAEKNEEKEKEKMDEKMIEHEKEKLDEYAEEVIEHMKRGGNRLTQKELRGMMNIGEAKVSLVVSELEEEKIIKKIKRGRGNILVLTEKGIAYAKKEEPAVNN